MFHLFGPLPSSLSFSFHLLFYFGAFLSEAVLVTLTLTRIFIVYQVKCRSSNYKTKSNECHLFKPVRFCNLNHEVVYKKLVLITSILALIPIVVDLLYEYGTSEPPSQFDPVVRSL